MSVRNILKHKENSGAFISPNSHIRSALTALEFEEVGALVVSSDGEKILGILSERDIVRGLRYYGPEILSKRVSEFMTKAVITCDLSDNIVEVIAKMHENKIRHVPVLDNKRFVGIISAADVIGDRLNDLEREADAMRTYISGSTKFHSA